MKQINYRNLTAGQTITVVTAWSDTETFDDIASGHFFKTTITKVYFETRGENGFLRVFAKDGDGQTRRVNYILEENEVRSTGVVVSIAELTKFSEMLCLNDRKDEFRSALRRAEQSALDELIDVSDRAVREQFDMNRAISERKSPEDIERETFEAYEKSRQQYEFAKKYRRQSQNEAEDEKIH